MKVFETPHYKLYVQLQDLVLFENELLKNDIPFEKEENPIGNTIRFYFPDTYSEAIDSIEKELGIMLTIESMPFDYAEKTKKFYLLYALIFIAVIIILAII